MTRRLLPVLFLLASVATGSTAMAHLLKIDGDIGVLMHIDPSDAPLERQKATLFLEIKDRSGQFAPGRCECRLSIASQGRQIFAAPVFRGELSSAVSFSFPAAGAYRVEVSGVPAVSGAFQPFRVAFEVRVQPR